MSSKKAPALGKPLTLKKLREARSVTQEYIAKRLHKRQASVAKLEKRDNPRFSTIVSVLNAMGGKLKMSVSFPDGTTNELIFAGRKPVEADQSITA